MKHNDIESLRRTYGHYRGESMSANAVLSLCDELEAIRLAIAERRNRLLDKKDNPAESIMELFRMLPK